mmetsp:Transcript_1639/g.2235  ORF Transcript_1639/g.2235 Transcript_1639/m.2235 type:complete len:194 (-) Transcript_1639:380-961(-)
MKYSLFAFAMSLSVVGAFVPSITRPQRAPLSVASSPTTFRMSSMESDFGSAMPTKPDETLSEKMIKAATEYMGYIGGSLGEGVPEPQELDDLRKARDGGEPKDISAKLYTLMCEQGMLYDRDENGVMTPTEFDIKNNLDVPEVKAEFGYLYKYGMNLIDNGLIDAEDCKKIVIERLIERTGLTPQEFDEWLGY